MIVQVEDGNSLARAKQLVGIVVAVLVIGVFVPSSSFAAKAVLDSYATWQRAARALEPAGTLYRPTFRAGLRQNSRIDVLAFKRSIETRKRGKYSSMLITANYSKRLRSFSIMEKKANVKWAARRVADPSQRIVERRTIRLNDSKTKVRATIYANCPGAEPGETVRPGTRCTRSDVKAFGGLLVMRAPAKTSIIVESNGLSYSELIGVARGLKQVKVGN